MNNSAILLIIILLIFTSPLYIYSVDQKSDKFMPEIPYQNGEIYILKEVKGMSWENNEWINSRQYVFTYYNHRNIKQEIRYFWSGYMWGNFEKILNIYDEKLNIIEKQHFYWNDFANFWDQRSNITYSYDSGNNLIEEIFAIYDINEKKHIYSYNERNLKTGWLTLYWKDGKWENSSKETYEYYDNDSIKTEYKYNWNDWDSEFKRWRGETKKSYTYENNMIRIVTQTIDPNSESYSNYILYENYYDNDNFLSESFTSFWENNNWLLRSDLIYEYNELGENIIQLGKVYENDIWVNSLRFLLSYDNNGNPIESIFQGWVNNDWENDYKYVATYEVFTDVEDNTLPNYSSLSASPNPFNNTTILSFSLNSYTNVRIRVIDLYGNVVKTLIKDYLQIGEYQIPVNRDDLSNGMYYCVISYGDAMGMIKLILID